MAVLPQVEAREEKQDSLPLVSIILPVYNDQDTLADCLKSLRVQSYSNFELIVVNDGSNDRSPQIASEFAATDPRMRVLPIAHSGTSAAKNAGFESSKGSIIFFAEGDAIYMQDYLSKAVECIRTDTAIGGVCVLGGVWETRRTFVTRSIDAENQIRDTLLIFKGQKPLRCRKNRYSAFAFVRRPQ